MINITNKIKQTFILFLFFTAVNTANSQIIDSIKYSLHKKPSFNIKGDNRNSFILNRRARINGIKIMLTYNNNFNIGLGYNFLNSDIYKKINNFENTGDTINTKLQINTIGFFAEYVFYNEKKYQMSIPIQIEIGQSNYKYSNKKIYKNPIVIYETSLQGHYKIIPWIGIGLGAGYRIMLLNNKKIDTKLNSPIYIFKILIFFGDIYNDVFNKKNPQNWGFFNNYIVWY